MFTMLKKYFYPVSLAKEFTEQKSIKRAVVFILIQAVLIGLIPAILEVRSEILIYERYAQGTQGFFGFVISCMASFALTSALMGVMFSLALKLITQIQRMNVSFSTLFCLSGACNFLMIPWTVAACIPMFFVSIEVDYYHEINEGIPFLITGLMFFFGLAYSLFSTAVALKETTQLSGDVTVRTMAFSTILMIVFYSILDFVFYDNEGMIGEYVYYLIMQPSTYILIG